MGANFPGSLDDGTSLPNPTATSLTNSPSLAGLSDNQNAAVIAVETKIGTGASTPTNNTFLTGNGTGTSVWSKVVPAGTVVGTSDSQTLTNKTLTSPTVNTATITNPTLTVDAVTGFSSGSTGTVYGMSVTAGVLASAAIAGQVVTASLASGSVTYAKLTTDSTWAYTVATLTPTGFSGTPTTNIARYIQIGKTVHLVVDFTGTSTATTCTFTLPVAPKSAAVFQVIVTDSGSVATSPGLIVFSAASTTATCYKTLALGAFTNSGTKAVQGNLTYEAN